MESYRTMNDGVIQRQSDLALIPPTIENPDYVQYLKDKDSGAEILPFDYEAEKLRQKEENKKNYALFRERDYPKIGDQLDAIWKGEPFLSEMKAKIMAVKEKWPKYPPNGE